MSTLQDQRKADSVKLYSVLSSYLKNRPLKILRSVLNNDGFEVWRRLSVELQPTSRSRSLAMAQALVSFPSMSKGASLYDYVLTYEKLVDEYEKLSGLRYDPNLKIGTLLKGSSVGSTDLPRTVAQRSANQSTIVAQECHGNSLS